MNAPAKPFDLNNYVGTASALETEPVFLFVGPPKSGKTFAACSLSAKWPSDGPIVTRQKERVFLDDILILAADINPLEGLSVLNIDAPMIDLVALWADATFIRGNALLKKLIDLALVKYPNVKWIIFDTVSAFDAVANTSFGTGEGDGFAAYRAVLTEHRKLNQTLRSLGKGLAFTCHAKAASSSPDGATKLQAAATGLAAASGLIIPAITGQGLAFYQRDMAAQIVTEAVRTPTGVQFSLYPHGKGQFQGGARYALLGEKEEPPMRKVLQRINDAKGKKQ